MSQALFLRVAALEARVAELERLTQRPTAEQALERLRETGALTSYKYPAHLPKEATPPFRSTHKGKGTFVVVSSNGVELETENLLKDHALTMAAELNGALIGVEGVA